MENNNLWAKGQEVNAMFPPGMGRSFGPHIDAHN